MDSIPPTTANDGEVVTPSMVDPFLVEALQNPRHRLTTNQKKRKPIVIKGDRRNEVPKVYWGLGERQEGRHEPY
ncbi:single-stranded nucleic acid binding R3H protein [Actinidia rufa]|uniref:Single-stranded nucleic acid binding R3H protein n=1 Tax=Actinidia rufa TaxID=165716 RepID=A0A7J0EDX9_9ERIC|nr:single-stranded nucleic acid binding R3H protein [Actinidia rufa]